MRNMSINVVTIDFWNTLFDSEGGQARNTERRGALRRAIIESGHLCDDLRLEEAYAGIWEYFDHHWLNHQRTPTTGEMIGEICRRLDLAITEESAAAAAEVFTRGVLSHPPSLLPGVVEGLEYLAGRARLALISDTAFSPGSVLRELMEQTGVARFFDHYVFSDETGVAKPHPEAFRRALEPLGGTPATAFHIGDIERTDIRGARSAGMKAVLYRGNLIHHKYAEEGTDADAVMEEWNEIPDVFERIDRNERE